MCVEGFRCNLHEIHPNLNDLQAGCFILHNGKEGDCRERKRGSVQSTSRSFSQAPVFL